MIYSQKYYRASGLVTAGEAERLFGLKPMTLYQWNARGHIEAGQRIGRNRLFYKSEVLRLIAARMPHLIEETRNEQ